MKLILFEDTDEQAESLMTALKEHGGRPEVLRFAPSDSADNGIYDERLSVALSQAKYKDANLIIADRDLSKTPTYQGLSEPTVRRAAHSLGIPECSYARSQDENEFLLAAEQRESCIAVSIKQGNQKCADQLVSIAMGFADIVEKMPRNLISSGKPSMGKILAEVLGKPEYAEKISLYASGDQSRLAAVYRVRQADTDHKLRQLACLVGYWLWDSVLRYPGVVVNSIAASSYLNIDADEFLNNTNLRLCFQSARYSGPFANAREDLWWRGMLDDIVATNGVSDGREFASKQLGVDVPKSKCCDDPTVAAGYYCMLSERPVSLKNSKPGLAWFPRGADLARISTSKSEELGPWI